MNQYPPIVILGQAPPPTTAVAEKPADPGIVPQAPPVSGLSPGAVNGAVTVSLMLILIVLGWFVVKHGKGKFRDVLVGSCIGVVGAGGIVGQLVWVVIGIGVKVVQAAGSAIAS